MMISGHVIAKCLYATGRRPFALPYRRNYVPAKLTCPRHVNTLLFNASLFSFSRGVTLVAGYTLRRPRLYCITKAD